VCVHVVEWIGRRLLAVDAEWQTSLQSDVGFSKQAVTG
jgi:hypothetical protein